MGQFRSTDTIVVARQWFPEGKPVLGVYGLLPRPLVERVQLPEGVYLCSEPCTISSHGTLILIAPGDWIVTEPDGIHHFAVPDEIFRAQYQALEAPENPN